MTQRKMSMPWWLLFLILGITICTVTTGFVMKVYSDGYNAGTTELNEQKSKQELK